VQPATGILPRPACQHPPRRGGARRGRVLLAVPPPASPPPSPRCIRPPCYLGKMSPGLALVDVPDALCVDAKAEADHPGAHALIELSPRVVDPGGPPQRRGRRKNGAIDLLEPRCVRVVRSGLRDLVQVPRVDARLFAARVQDHPGRRTTVLQLEHVPVSHGDAASEPEDTVAAIVHGALPVPARVIAAGWDQIAEPRRG
jgi:hypothetical protein